jgi:hypothetical protein
MIHPRCIRPINRVTLRCDGHDEVVRRESDDELAAEEPAFGIGREEPFKSEDFEPVMQEYHPPKAWEFDAVGRRNHDSRKIHLGDVFIDCSCGLGAV